jgi:hypothetical protein
MAQERPAEVILKRDTEPSGPPIAAVEAGLPKAYVSAAYMLFPRPRSSSRQYHHQNGVQRERWAGQP